MDHRHSARSRSAGTSRQAHRRTLSGIAGAGRRGAAFTPGAPRITLEPELALALFLAPVLLDAAYDTSPRDLKDNWLPVTCLVLVAVGLTTAAVAIVAHALTGMPWAAAIA